MSRSFRAPGRVNLIGEHTDYNLGFVLPVALDMACFVERTPSPDGLLRIHSEQHNESKEWLATEIATLKSSRHWTDYPIGVAQELLRLGISLEPMTLRIRSTVPEGSGLSSSAALEVSTALAFLGGRDIDRLELARLCQRAERNFVGMPCGIMDQYVSVFGREHAAIKIDCRSLEHEAVRLPDGVEFLAVNSMVKHELANSAYKQRTQECAAAVEAIRKRYPGVLSLRDASLEQLDSVAPEVPPEVAKRARHIITENARVEEFVEACRREDLQRMGQLFVESHRSLQQDFEVSCEELDFLVNTALQVGGVYGARMTGGGFGGCTVNMLDSRAMESFRELVPREYERRFGVTPQIFPCRPSAGAGEVPSS